MKWLMALTLSVSVYAAFEGPLRQEGRIVELKRNSVVVISKDGKRNEVARSAIKDGNKLRAGQDIAWEVPADKVMKELKNSQKKTKI